MEKGYTMYYCTIYSSPIGELTLGSDGAALTGLWLEGQKYFGGRENVWQRCDGLPVFASARQWLDAYFAGQAPPVSPLPLAPQGTVFQQEVWQLLLEIPYGTTTTYGTLAAQLAQRRGLSRFSAQAVGSAVGKNPISIIVPCHRVVASDGALTGYAGGIPRKEWLLCQEGIKMANGKVSRQQ